MLLVITFIGCFAIFATAILLVGRPTTDEKQMTLRFAGLRGKVESTRSPNSPGDLLRAGGPAVSGLERLLTRISIATKIEPLIQQSDSKTTIKKLLFTCLGAGLCGTLLFFLFVPSALVSLVAGLGTSYLPIFVLSFRRQRRIVAFNKVLPDAIETMSRSLRAGHSMVAAISIVAENGLEPAKTEFGEVFRQQNFGLPLRDTLMQLLERVPSQDLRVLVTGILVQRDTGGNLAEILDRIVAVIRERLKIQGEIRTHTAQGRMTGWILCLLPVVMLAVINMINPGYSKSLTDNPLGLKMLYLGFGLLAFGAFLIKHIVGSIEV